MSYIPNPNDTTQPADTVDISTAAAEFRALKAFLHEVTTIASATTPDIFNAATQQINYTGTATCTGFVAALNAGEAARTLFCAGAAVFTAGANLLIDGVTSGQNLTCATGTILRIYAISTTQFRIIQVNAVASKIAITAPVFNGAGTGLTGTAAGLSIGGSAGSVPYSGLTGTAPTWNQDTTGKAAAASYADVAGTVPYSGLSGGVPTWNQNTTGTAAGNVPLDVNGGVGTFCVLYPLSGNSCSAGGTLTGNLLLSVDGSNQGIGTNWRQQSAGNTNANQPGTFQRIS